MRSGRILSLLGLCFFLSTACRATADDLHSWGTFNTTRTRLGDTCQAVDGGCFIAASSTLITLGVHGGSPASAVLKRASNMDVTGTQSGSRFLFSFDTAEGGVTQTVCGCDATTKETFWGELLTGPFDAGTADVDAGIIGCDGGDGSVCAWWIAQPPCGSDPGLEPGEWIPDGGPLPDLNVQYSGFVGTLVDELTAAPGSPDGGCPCLPCRVTYQLSGKF